jgi:hypothetical protein
VSRNLSDRFGYRPERSVLHFSADSIPNAFQRYNLLALKCLGKPMNIKISISLF